MTSLAEGLDDWLGTESDTGDIRIVVKPVWHYDFASQSIWLWKGHGKLSVLNPDGGRITCIGTLDANGADGHQVPEISDGRDGSAGQLSFGFPYLDQSTFDDIKSLHEEVSGRLITSWSALVLPEEEGLVVSTDLDFFGEFTMQTATFSHRPRLVGATVMQARSIQIAAKGGSAGRSRAGGETYTDPSQQRHAQRYGVAIDNGAGFVTLIANETMQFP